MTAITAITDTGGSPIVSYCLEWDGATQAASFTPLTGYVNNNI